LGSGDFGWSELGFIIGFGLFAMSGLRGLRDKDHGAFSWGRSRFRLCD
jgi:hypothetical protein